MKWGNQNLDANPYSLIFHGFNTLTHMAFCCYMVLSSSVALHSLLAL